MCIRDSRVPRPPWAAPGCDRLPDPPLASAQSLRPSLSGSWVALDHVSVRLVSSLNCAPVVDRVDSAEPAQGVDGPFGDVVDRSGCVNACLLYTSDAADEE